MIERSRPASLGAEDAAADLTRWVEGRRALAQVRGYGADEMEALRFLAFITGRQGRTEDARALLGGLTTLDPEDVWSWRSLGLLELSADDPTAAAHALSQVVSRCPRDLEAVTLLAEAKLRARQTEEARELLLSLLRRAASEEASAAPVLRFARALLASTG